MVSRAKDTKRRLYGRNAQVLVDPVMVVALQQMFAAQRPMLLAVRPEPEIHRVDPESGSTLRLLQGFPVKLLGQLANFWSNL